MSHGLTSIDVVESIREEWHNLQAIRSQEEMNRFEGGALDCNIEWRPLVWGGNKKATELIVRGDKELTRQIYGLECKGNILSTATKTYGLTQNVEFWDLINTLILEHGANCVSRGTIYGCKRAFASVELPDSIIQVSGNDPVNFRVNFINAHDKSQSMVGCGGVRQVCANTVALTKSFLKGAMASGESLAEMVRKTKNVGDRLKLIKFALIDWANARVAFEEACNALAAKKSDRVEMELFTVGLLSKDGGKLTTTARNTANDVANLAFSGIGNKGETRWDLFNGITERYTRGNGDDKDPAKAWMSSEFGASAAIKSEALESIIDDDTFNRLVENGEKLLKEWEESKAGKELATA